MKEMTTAEFGRANLAALTEPVKIRRYTKAVGTYYPEGYIAGLPEAEPPLTTGFAPVIPPPDQSPSLSAAREKIEELENEVKRLKRELAARPPESPEPADRVIPPLRIEHPMKDVFAGLAKQDREFFERKLGKKTSKS
jgi:hypothetical protein